jgi:hypothetical protein
MRLAALLTLLALAACGADGPPTRPQGSIGVGVGTGGVFLDGEAELGNSSVSVGIGI